jgi:GMP synthase-like glutamine amidotransferase
MSESPRVLVLDNAIHRAIYRPFQHWRDAFPEEIQLIRAPREEPPPTLDGVTHLLISGSEASILDGDPWVPAQLPLIREAARRGMPVLGSCHGHQMIALALGGADCVRRAAMPELGWIQLDVQSDDPMFAGATAPPWVFASHFDEVARPPDGFVAPARSPRCAIHALRHRELPIWGLQSHPEILPDEGERVLRGFRQLDHRVAAATIDRPARDSGYLADLVRNFIAAR